MKPFLKCKESIVFLSLLFVIPLLIITKTDTKSKTSVHEKKSLEPWPNVFITNERFPRQMDSYIEDRIGLKYEFRNLMKIFPFLQPTVNDISDPVIVGINDWLYFNNNSETLQDFLKLDRYSEQQLALIKKRIDELNEWCIEHEIKLIVVVSPFKHNIYPEYYNRKYIPINKTSKYEQLLNYMKGSDTTFIDVYSPLLANKKSQQLYFKQDTHWNYYAGYIAFQEIRKTINAYGKIGSLPLINKNDINVIAKNEMRQGDLLMYADVRTTIADADKEVYAEVQNGVDVKELSRVSYQDSRYDNVIESTLEGGLRLFVVRDSFFDFIMPYMEKSVRRIVSKFVWGISPLKFEEEIIKEKPDILIWQMHQRYLQHILDNSYLKDGGLVDSRIVEQK